MVRAAFYGHQNPTKEELELREINIELNNSVNDEDLTLCERVQKGLQTHGYKPGPLSRTRSRDSLLSTRWCATLFRSPRLTKRRTAATLRDEIPSSQQRHNDRVSFAAWCYSHMGNAVCASCSRARDRRPATDNTQSGYDDIKEFGGPESVGTRLKENDEDREADYMFDNLQRGLAPYFRLEARHQ